MAYSMLRGLERRRSQPCGCGRWLYGLPWSRAGRRLATTCRARGGPCVPGSFANYVTFSCYPPSVFPVTRALPPRSYVGSDLIGNLQRRVSGVSAARVDVDDDIVFERQRASTAPAGGAG